MEVFDIEFERPGTRSLACQVNYEFMFESIIETVKCIVDTLVETRGTQLGARIYSNGIHLYLVEEEIRH